MYVYIGRIHVDIPNRIQLCTGKIYGTRCVRRVGSHGCRLGIQSNLLRNPLFQWKMEEEGNCVERIWRLNMALD